MPVLNAPRRDATYNVNICKCHHVLSAALIESTFLKHSLSPLQAAGAKKKAPQDGNGSKIPNLVKFGAVTAGRKHATETTEILFDFIFFFFFCCDGRLLRGLGHPRAATSTEASSPSLGRGGRGLLAAAGAN